MNAFDVLVFAGFGFDPEAQALLQKTPVEKLEILFASVSPEVLVGDLLKTTRASQLFAVFGQPDVEVRMSSDGNYTAELRGVDIYDPVVGKVFSSQGGEAAAWFLDTDYDGMTFHISQAFFPGGKKAWVALQKALRTRIDHKTFQSMRGVVSFPFTVGEHKRIAVKVIDFRGYEVMTLVNLEGTPDV
jgi:adenine-specific DNA-methyltransferase